MGLTHEQTGIVNASMTETAAVFAELTEAARAIDLVAAEERLMADGSTTELEAAVGVVNSAAEQRLGFEAIKYSLKLHTPYFYTRRYNNSTFSQGATRFDQAPSDADFITNGNFTGFSVVDTANLTTAFGEHQTVDLPRRLEMCFQLASPLSRLFTLVPVTGPHYADISREPVRKANMDNGYYVSEAAVWACRREPRGTAFLSADRDLINQTAKN